MNRISYALSVAWKELQVIVSDRVWLMILFLMPFGFGAMIVAANPWATSGEAPAIHLDVGLVNDDAGGFGREIAKSIGGIQELDIETFDARAEAERRVQQGERAAAIVIPADFSQKIDAYTPTAIEVIVDPAQPESASIVTGIMNQVVAEVALWGEVQHGIRAVLNESGLLAGAGPEQQRAIEAQSLGVLMTRLNELRRNPAIAVVSEDLAGVESQGSGADFLAYVLPAFTVMFVFFVVALAAGSLLTERESGAFRRLLAAPIPHWTIIAGKMLAYMLVVCAQVAVLFSVAHFIFHMPLGTSPLALIAATIAVALAAAALGMLVATIAKTPKQADNIGVLAALIMAGIGGALPTAWPPIFRAEGFATTLSRLTPQAHAVEAYFSVMAENATLTQILPQVGILLAMAAVFFFVAARRFKFE
jgi:ABC-2 type transport system permease protein